MGRGPWQTEWYPVAGAGKRRGAALPEELVMQRHYIIHGRVQGVFFRDSTRRKALELGIHGWVRNRPDGSVEAMAAGDEAALDALEQWLRGGGPPAARVEEVVSEDVRPERLDSFRVR